MSKLVAFIPARGGSKSIKLKTIKPLCGRPMIYYVIDAAVACKFIDKVVVATDHPAIEDAVREYGNAKVEVVGRSPETATDEASTESAMIEYAKAHDFEYIVLIQATSPLLKPEHLDEGVELLRKGFDSVLSVTRQKRFIWKVSGDNEAVPVNYDPLHRPMRQSFDGFLVENGAFYITSGKDLLKSNCRLNGKIGVVELPEETYFEVDEPSDWAVVEQFLKKEQKLKFEVKAVFTDCDGVLTDGGMYYSEQGDELKKFNTKDGMAFELLREKGIITGIISGEDCDLLRRRAKKLKVDEVHLGIKNKLATMENILPKYNLDFSDILYIGDDINDIEVLKRAGVSCCVEDAVEEVKQLCHYITCAKGGGGAVREVAEMIMKEGIGHEFRSYVPHLQKRRGGGGNSNR